MITQLKSVVLLWNYNRFVSAVWRLGTCKKCIFYLTVLPWVKFLARNIFCKLMRMSYFPVNFEPLRNHFINFSMRLYKNIYLIGQQCCTLKWQPQDGVVQLSSLHKRGDNSRRQCYFSCCFTKEYEFLTFFLNVFMSPMI